MEHVAAGLLSWVGDAADSFGVTREALWAACGVEPESLKDPSAVVPLAIFESAIRYLLMHTGDRGLGLRMARPVDLRTQGFWGYALLASMTLRERLELHIRYQHLRFPAELSLTVDDDIASVVCRPRGFAPDVLPTILDWAIATACHQQRRHLGDDTQLEVWLTYPEEPHHQALRALVNGPVRFDAPVGCLRFPARHLALRMAGSDPYLRELACSQLDAHGESEVPPSAASDSGLPLVAADVPLLVRVQARIVARLAQDATIEAVAGDLGISTRTLRRRLGSQGVSFQQLLVEVRRARALVLLETDLAVDGVGAQLGYGEPSNFRRAFRRWTGQTPSAYRAAQRARTLGAARD